MHICRECGVILDDETWHISQRKAGNYMCKKCVNTQARLRRKLYPDDLKVIDTRHRRKIGRRPFGENKECSMFLGVHVAERVLSHVFNDVEVMPVHNPGYDIVCNKGKLIDVKGACIGKSNGGWIFHIRHNTIADYFLLLAFDNIDDLNPLYIWLIPGCVLNHLTGTGIKPSSIHKWDEYRLDIDGVVDCCNALR